MLQIFISSYLLLHYLKWSKSQREGIISGIFPHIVAVKAIFAIWGPSYNTNVCRPVSKPTEEAIPNTIQ